MRQTSSPETSRSLPNRDLNLRNEHLAVHAARDLALIGYFEKQCQGLDQIGSRLYDRRALAGNINFRAKRHEGVVFSFDNRRQTLSLLHAPSLLVRLAGGR